MINEPLSDTELRLAPPDIFKTAVISECGEYRYSLVREWDADKPRMCWVMLNPSTADASIDDPTIRRCVGFAKREGFGSIEVVNLFAYRSTDPNVLSETMEYIGPDNLRHLVRAFKAADLIVFAYGASKVADGGGDMVRRTVPSKKPVRCLGYTKSLRPKHPLYVRSDAEMVEF